jgi:hypothetical protein
MALALLDRLVSRSLANRGPRGGKLVIADDHKGRSGPEPTERAEERLRDGVHHHARPVPGRKEEAGAAPVPIPALARTPAIAPPRSTWGPSRVAVRRWTSHLDGCR